MGDQHYVLKAWTVLVGREGSPQFRRDAENGQQVVSSFLAFEFFGILAFAAQVEDVPRSSGDVLKKLGLVLPIRVIAGRGSIARESNMAVVFEDGNQLSGIAEGERAQQHGIHHAEDRRGCPNS